MSALYERGHSQLPHANPRHLIWDMPRNASCLRWQEVCAAMIQVLEACKGVSDMASLGKLA